MFNNVGYIHKKTYTLADFFTDNLLHSVLMLATKSIGTHIASLFILFKFNTLKKSTVNLTVRKDLNEYF